MSADFFSGETKGVQQNLRRNTVLIGIQSRSKVAGCM